jgi:hypothetical protein
LETTIFGYKIATAKEIPICTWPGWQYSPAIYRETVVWSDDTEGGAAERDIYAAAISKYVYVDSNATGSDDGWTWADAYPSLQDGLAAALKGDEILVAEGLYRPDEDSAHPLGTGDRTATFVLTNGVMVCGGFSADGGSWRVREPNIYETILSGDLDQNDVNVAQAEHLLDHPLRADNSYTVVSAFACDSTTVLDGFTITGGNANATGTGADPATCGAGMYNGNEGNPTLANCTFKSNSARRGGSIFNVGSGLTIVNSAIVGNGAEAGGGMFCDSNSALIVSACEFSDNFAVHGGAYFGRGCRASISDTSFLRNQAEAKGGGAYVNGPDSLSIADCNVAYNAAQYGGGLYIIEASNTIISGCEIRYNEAPAGGLIPGSTALGVGAGIYCWGSSAVISQCLIAHNAANNSGAGLSVVGESGPTQVLNCLIVNNEAGRQGAGISVTWGAEPIIAGCTFVGNRAVGSFSDERTGVGGGLCSSFEANPYVTDSIFWDNRALSGQEIAALSDYLLYQRVSSVAVSYTDIKGGQPAARVDDGCTLDWGPGNIDTDPCFGTPRYWDTNGTPHDANDDTWVDGDYHLMSVAGRWEPSGTPDVDLTADARTDLLDFAVLAGAWGQRGEGIPADLNNDGLVGMEDLTILVQEYLSEHKIGVWVADALESPCVDAGDPASEWVGEFWPHGSRANMGAYGGTAQASMSLSSVGNIADLNGDGSVSLPDFGCFASTWGGDRVLLPGDLDRNGYVNGNDLRIFAEQWLWQE